MFLSLESAASQETRDTSTVITVGKCCITAQEFSERLNFLPSGGTGDDAEERKSALLLALVAEKILASAATTDGLDTLLQVRETVREFEREACYEEWMHQRIQRTATVAQEDVRRAYDRFVQQRIVNYLIFPDSTSARRAERDLDAGRDIRSFLSANGDTLAATQTLSFGDALEPVEDLIYSLKPGQARVLRVEGSCFVFQLLKTVPHPLYSTQDLSYWQSSIEKRLRARAELRMFRSAASSFMKVRKFQIARQTREFVLRRLQSTLRFSDARLSHFPELANQELAAVKGLTANMERSPFLSFENGEVWTVATFWNMLRLGPFLLNYKNEEELEQQFNGLIRRVVLFESIVDAGYRERMDTSDYVFQQRSMWGASLLAKLFSYKLSRQIAVTTTDEQRFYDRHRAAFAQFEKRRILEILVRDRPFAERLVDRIRQGEDMSSLVNQYSLRRIDGVPPKEGFWIDRGTWGKIGRIAFSLDTNQLYGPIDLDSNYFSIIRVINIKDSSFQSLDSVRSTVRSRLAGERLQALVDSVLNAKINLFPIRIDRGVLRSVLAVPGNLAVRKSHFPNRFVVPSALPVNPNAAWARQVLRALDQSR